jgi:hypothetical protein
MQRRTAATSSQASVIVGQMERARLALLLAFMGLSGCYTKFKGAISIAADTHSLRMIGAFSPDGTQFAAAEAKLSDHRSETGVLKVWKRGPHPDLPGSWRLTTRVDLADLFIVDLTFSPDGRILAMAGLGRQNHIVLWDVAQRRMVGMLRGNAPVTQSIAFGPGGDWLVSAGIDGQIHIWDVQRRTLRATVREDRALLLQSRFPLAVARDGKWIAYARTDGQVALASSVTGERLEIRPTGGKEVYDLAPSADGRWLAVASDSGIRLWDLSLPTAKPVSLSSEQASAIAFFPDSRTLLACGHLPGHSKVLAIPSGQVTYGFLKGSTEARNRRLPEEEPQAALRTADARIWRRYADTFPIPDDPEPVRSLVLGYARFPSVHRVAISPENLWVAFFEGGRASIIITERHYRLLLERPLPPTPKAPAPAPRRPSAPEKSI